LELLAHAQIRLAKSDALRQAAKIEVQMHEELESKVESRVQQAEINRMESKVESFVAVSTAHNFSRNS